MANPEDNNNDNWKKAVDLLTGYVLPERKTLFDDLKGNDGIPLIHVRLDKHGGPEYSSGFLSSSGWKTHNTDYTIPFYRPSDDSQDVSAGKYLYRYRAYITFLASGQSWPPSGDDVIPDYTKTSERLKDKGGWNKEGEKLDWNTNALVRYVYGSRDALSQITMWPYSTHGFKNRGYPVDDADYVDLRTFTDAAKAFDRVVKFFEDSAVTVGKWDTENIGEGSDSWDGTSAAIFKELIHKLARNYEGYADQLNGRGGDDKSAVTVDGVTVTSEPARALADAQGVLLAQAQKLHDAWEAWKAESNPQRWLYDMLQNARLTLFDTQYDKTDIDTVSSGSGPYTSWHNYVVSTDGFQNEIVIEGKSYGKPSEMTTWKVIADEAVRRWEQSVQDWLSTAGAEAIVAIHNAFKTAEKAFDTSITDKDDRPLSEISAEAEAEAEKKKAAAEAAAAKAEAEKEKAEAKAEAEKEKAEAKAERDAEKAEAEKEKAEAKAEAEKEKAEAKAEQEKEKAEAKAEQAAAKEEAAKEKAEAKAEAEKEKAEAEAEQAAAKEEAEKEKAEAKAEQEKEKAEAKQAAAEQQAFVVAQNQKAQDEAKKERERAAAQAEADRAEAKAEQEAAKEEAAKEKAEAKAEQDAEKAEAKREQEAAKAEAKAEQDAEKAEAKREQEAAKAEAEKEKAEAKAEQEAAQAEAKREQAAAKAEADAEKEAAKQEQADAQSRAETEREEARREALQEKQQARLDAQNAKADAQADYEEQKAEARAEREAALQDADRQEAAARQEYEQEKAEAQEQRDQAREDAEQERAEARREYEREIASGTDRDEARQEYDRRIEEIDAAEREAVERADAAEADARSEYDRAKADAQAERQEARTEAEQARKDAKADYDRRMADIQAEYDRIGAGGKDIDELIRERIADLPEPPDLSAYNPGGPSGSAYSSAFSDNLYNQDDLASALGRPQGGDAMAGASADGTGTGAGSPGMYPPMMRGAGGEAGGGSGERTRNVIEPGVGRPGRTAATTAAVDDEEHRVVPRTTQTSSSTPFMPPMGPMGGAGEGRPQTESGDRERTTWLAEDEDVWGTDEGGAPQALGR
ncbi:AAWKG family protein [Streptomyces fungicidicus]|uniref:AAWKG family protein n=1 Tax=Streptomyces fungicidicus TaxID=68203 RepID=UPI0034088A85